MSSFDLKMIDDKLISVSVQENNQSIKTLTSDQFAQPVLKQPWIKMTSDLEQRDINIGRS